MPVFDHRNVLASPPIWAVCLLALVWLLPGLFGSEPWKPDSAYTFGLISHISVTGDWVVPMLAGEPFMEKPPLFFITAALFNNLLGGWLLAPINAMRLATGLYIGLSFVALGLAARELFGRGYGRWAVIVLLGCLGFPVRAHQLITDTALFAGISWAMYGLILAPRWPKLAGLLLGAGMAAALLSKGLLGPGVVGLTALLLWVVTAYRTRAYGLTLLIALLAFLPLPALWMSALYQRSPELFHIWWWDNNFGRFLGSNHLGPRATRGFYFWMLPWYALPAWLLALGGLWRLHRCGELVKLAAPLMLFAVNLTVLSIASDARELYGMPLLAPLALLAVAGIMPSASLGRCGRSFWAGIAIVLLFLLVLGGYALATGTPADFYRWILAPRFVGWEPHWVPVAWAAATAVVVCLIGLWRVAPMQRLSGSLWRWAILLSGIWAALGTLYLPALDLQMAYRLPFRSLRADLLRAQQSSCVASLRLGEPQRALLAFYGGTVTRRLENHPDAVQCRWLLVQSENGWRPSALAGLVPAKVVARPGDDKERYLLYALPQSLAELGFISR